MAGSMATYVNYHVCDRLCNRQPDESQGEEIIMDEIQEEIWSRTVLESIRTTRSVIRKGKVKLNTVAEASPPLSLFPHGHDHDDTPELSIMSDAPILGRHIFATNDGEEEEGVQAVMSDALTSGRDLFATDDSLISSVITGQEEEGVETAQGGDFGHGQNLLEDVGGGSSQKLLEHVGSEVSFGSGQNLFKSPSATQKSVDKEESMEQSKGQKRKVAKQLKGASKPKWCASKKAN
ncbi:hypothetical protein EMPG_10853 [Blastomyces silverae]|uniref:Uncharacterized protein n=1 Tax=Blastomyces silverae TaxID=2060906 RepID=A0A0H1B2M7_9EURO|nr:hypothetical protein EMPG_10853 [Blastomyces silverae]